MLTDDTKPATLLHRIGWYALVIVLFVILFATISHGTFWSIPK